MSANRLRPQGSGNSRGSQARLAAAQAVSGVVAMSASPGHHSATFWPSSNSSFQTLSELQDPNENNNANHLALERQQQLAPRPAWSSLQGVVPNAASFTSLQELYGQELGRSMHGAAAAAAAAGHVKAESTTMMDQQSNSFLQCRGSDQLDLNYGWERYISS